MTFKEIYVVVYLCGAGGGEDFWFVHINLYFHDPSLTPIENILETLVYTLYFCVSLGTVSHNLHLIVYFIIPHL